MEELKKLFESGSMLIKDRSGDEQLLMNQGTFIALVQNLEFENEKKLKNLLKGLEAQHIDSFVKSAEVEDYLSFGVAYMQEFKGILEFKEATIEETKALPTFQEVTNRLNALESIISDPTGMGIQVNIKLREEIEGEISKLIKL